MPQNLICKLQNNAASLISHSAKSDHIISDPLCSTLASCQIPYSVQNSSSYLYSTEQPTPLPISLISSSFMFCLANSICLLILNSFVFHPTTSSPLVNAPSSIFSPLDSECLPCVHAVVCHWLLFLCFCFVRMCVWYVC